jgi:hypothetical protein
MEENVLRGVMEVLESDVGEESTKEGLEALAGYFCPDDHHQTSLVYKCKRNMSTLRQLLHPTFPANFTPEHWAILLTIFHHVHPYF